MLVLQWYTKIKNQASKVWKSVCKARNYNNAPNPNSARDEQDKRVGCTKGNVPKFFVIVLFLFVIESILIWKKQQLSAVF